jgi:hypothetical protein
MKREISNIMFYQGLATKDQIEEWVNNSEHSVLILDNSMTQVAKCEDTAALFSVTAHHNFCDTKFISAVKNVSQSVIELSLRAFISFIERYKTNIAFWCPSE